MSRDDPPCSSTTPSAIARGGDDRHGMFVEPETFAAQMAYLARQRVVVPLADAVDDRATDRSRRAGRDHVRRWIPVCLRARASDLGATQNLGDRVRPSAFIGSVNGWEEPDTGALPIMSAKELREAEQRGLAVESHGHRHIDLSRSDPEITRRDLQDGVQSLTEIMQRRVRFLAYPFGQASQEARALAESAGFDAAFTTNRDTQSPFYRSRISISEGDSVQLFRLKTSGYYEALRTSARRVRRVVR